MNASGYSSPQKRDEHVLVEVVCRVTARVLDGTSGDITGQTLLTPDNGVDSLAFVEIIELVESEVTSLVGHPVVIDDSQFERLRTVADVARYVANRAEGGRVDESP